MLRRAAVRRPEAHFGGVSAREYFMHESRPGGGGDRHVRVPQQVNVEWNGDFARQAVDQKGHHL